MQLIQWRWNRGYQRTSILNLGNHCKITYCTSISCSVSQVHPRWSGFRWTHQTEFLEYCQKPRLLIPIGTKVTASRVPHVGLQKLPCKQLCFIWNWVGKTPKKTIRLEGMRPVEHIRSYRMEMTSQPPSSAFDKLNSPKSGRSMLNPQGKYTISPHGDWYDAPCQRYNVNHWATSPSENLNYVSLLRRPTAWGPSR